MRAWGANPHRLPPERNTMTRKEIYDQLDELDKLRFLVGAATYRELQENGQIPLQAGAAAELETVELETMLCFLLELQAAGADEAAAADRETLESCSDELAARYGLPSTEESWERFKAAHPEYFS